MQKNGDATMKRMAFIGSLLLALAAAEPGLGQGFLLVDSDRFRLPRPLPTRPLPPAPRPLLSDQNAGH